MPQTVLAYFMHRGDLEAMARVSKHPFARSPRGIAAFRMGLEIFHRLEYLGPLCLATARIGEFRGMALIPGLPNQEFDALPQELRVALLKFFRKEPQRLTRTPERGSTHYSFPKPDGSGEEFIRIGEVVEQNQ